jgi:hypothetical protein
MIADHTFAANVTSPDTEASGMIGEERSIHFSNFTIAAGASERVPYLPDHPGSFIFTQRLRQRSFDPPVAQGFDFTATGTAKFAEIMSFPSTAGSAFQVIAEGSDLGTFGATNSVNFLTLVGHGVTNFQVKGIQPFVNATNPTAFPIMLDFTQTTADFTTTPILAPDLQLEPQTNGDLQITFNGVLQYSSDLSSNSWTDITPTPTSPYLIPKAALPARKFFRTRDP